MWRLFHSFSFHHPQEYSYCKTLLDLHLHTVLSQSRAEIQEYNIKSLTFECNRSFYVSWQICHLELDNKLCAVKREQAIYNTTTVLCYRQGIGFMTHCGHQNPHMFKYHSQPSMCGFHIHRFKQMQIVF